MEVGITQVLGRRSIEFKYRKSATLRDLLDKIEEKLQSWGRKDIPAAPNTFYIRYYHRDSDETSFTKQVLQQIPIIYWFLNGQMLGSEGRFSLTEIIHHTLGEGESEDNRDIPITPQDFAANGIYPIGTFNESKKTD